MIKINYYLNIYLESFNTYKSVIKMICERRTLSCMLLLFCVSQIISILTLFFSWFIQSLNFVPFYKPLKYNLSCVFLLLKMIYVQLKQTPGIIRWFQYCTCQNYIMTAIIERLGKKKTPRSIYFGNRYL